MTLPSLAVERLKLCNIYNIKEEEELYTLQFLTLYGGLKKPSQVFTGSPPF